MKIGEKDNSKIIITRYKDITEIYRSHLYSSTSPYSYEKILSMDFDDVREIDQLIDILKDFRCRVERRT